MKEGIRRSTAFSLIAALACFPSLPVTAGAQNSTPADPPLPLRDTLQKGYPELFDLAPTLNFEPREIQKLRETFKGSKDSCRNTFRSHAKLYNNRSIRRERT